jgi:hypothetical protein
VTVVVFTGPTLSGDAVRSIIDADVDVDVRPPAARGDVLRAALRKPAAIGLIDGYFAHVPAVWHKEILWAMSEGVHVFGAASMGALRAAELSSFGMEGTGVVFQRFVTGDYIDDDEVAVVHGSSDDGFRALSDAMVNVRETVHAAAREGIISEATALALRDTAKALPYAERCYPRILELAAARLAARQVELAAFRRWLPQGRVDQKRDDAVEMLQLIAERQRSGWTAKEVTYSFARTDAWETLRREVVRDAECAATYEGSQVALFEELHASGRAAAAYTGGLLRAVCLEVARQAGTRMDARATEAVIEEFRRERSALDSAQFQHWLLAQEVREQDVVSFFEREALIRGVLAGFETNVSPHVIDYLRTTGELEVVVAIAEKKRRALAQRGIEIAELRDTDMVEEQLWQWYFRERLRGAVPSDLDAYARSQHTDLGKLRAIAIREYLAR